MRSRLESGVSLIEMLVYLGVLGVVLALAYPAFYQVAKASNDLKRNAEDLARALATGERWRSDVRAATKPPVVMHTAEGDTVWLLQGTNTVGYAIQNATVWRYRAGAWAPELRGVRRARVYQSNRRQVVAWRWEIELETARPDARVQPWFSFVAVAGGGK